MTKRSGIAHFVVEGEFITVTARRLWAEEDEPEKALNLLEYIRGLTKGQQLDVLEGRSKLIGDSSAGIELVPDKPSKKTKTLKEVLTRRKTERDEAKDERDDLAQMATGDTVMVASTTGAREIPRRKAKRWMSGAGFDGKIGGGAGYLDPEFEFDDTLERLEKEDVQTEKGLKRRKAKPQRIYRELAQPQRRTRAEEIVMERLAPREPEKTEEELEAEEKAARAAARFSVVETAQPKITQAAGWLSPEGKFYPCGYAQHAFTVWALGLIDNPHHHGAEIDGWVRLGKTDDRQYFFGEHTLFNDVQNASIRAWCAESGADLPYWLKEEA